MFAPVDASDFGQGAAGSRKLPGLCGILPCQPVTGPGNPALELPNIWLQSDILRNSGIKDAQKLVSFDMRDLDRPDKSLFDEAANGAPQAAFGTRPAGDKEHRDSVWLRWVKPFLIILVPPIRRHFSVRPSVGTRMGEARYLGLDAAKICAGFLCRRSIWPALQDPMA